MSKNKQKSIPINWEQYNMELTTYSEKISNEYQHDLHNMTVKESLVKNVFICPAYKRAMDELKDFDTTNLDYLNYEKELTLGESN